MDENTKEQIVKEAKRIEEDSLHSARGHFEAAACWDRVHLWIGVSNSALAAVAGASVLTQWSNVLGGILALVVSTLSAINAFLNPNKKAVSHLNAGNQYNGIRNNVRIFHEINLNLLPNDKQIMEELKQLNDKRNELNQNSPLIPRWAYERGKRGIEKGEAEHRVDRG